ncbi:hypothetical protein BH20ACT17_BH20ACT17_13140 [soil metagenome]
MRKQLIDGQAPDRGEPHDPRQHHSQPPDRHLVRRCGAFHRRVSRQASWNLDRPRRVFEGTLEIGDDISTAKAHGKIKAASIDTNEPQRDDHLRSADFFGVENHPDITFESTAITPLDEDTFEVTGDLTMHGVTKPITLTVETTGVEQQDPWGNERVGLEALGKLDRSEWDMRFNQALGSGNMMVSDKVTISLDISAVKQA